MEIAEDSNNQVCIATKARKSRNVGFHCDRRTTLRNPTGTLKAQGRTIYWLGGIPKSDDRELKELMLKALVHMRDENYKDAIEQLENILRTCTVSPTGRMSILLNLGNAYYRIGQSQMALRNCDAVLNLAPRVNKADMLRGKSTALANIGQVYMVKGNPDKALKYHHEALKIARKIGYRRREAATLGNIGLVYSNKGARAIWTYCEKKM